MECWEGKKRIGKGRKWIIVAWCLPLLLAGAAVAGPVIIILPIFRTDVLTVPSNEFFDSSGPPSRNSQARIEANMPSGFNFDASSIGERIFRFTWRAPDGFLFEIRSPRGYSPSNLSFQLRGNGSFVSAGSFGDSSPTIAISGARGNLPAPKGGVSMSGPAANPPGIGLFLNFDDVPPGQRFFLESVSLSTTVPSSYAAVFSSVPVQVFFRGEASFAGNPASFPPHRGQWIRLVSKAAVAQEEAARKRQRNVLRSRIRRVKRQIRVANRRGEVVKVRKLKRNLRTFQRRLRRVQGPFP